MNEKDQYKNRIELLQGTLDMFILQTLQWGPQHGYGIVQALRLQNETVSRVFPAAAQFGFYTGLSRS